MLERRWSRNGVSRGIQTKTRQEDGLIFMGNQSLWFTIDLLCGLSVIYMFFEHLHEARSCSPQNPRIESKLESERDAYHQKFRVLLRTLT